MRFYDAMRESVFTRLEQIEPTLTRSREYLEGMKALEAELDALPGEAAERVRDAITHMFDLYSRFFYAAGMQDGVKITGADFPLEICGDRQI